MIVNDKLTLQEAHDLCTNYENELKRQSKNLTRIITHIESTHISEDINPKPYICKPFESSVMESITNKIKEILKAHPHVKGYHGFEFWTILDSNVIEIHVFFDGTLNISKIHEYTTDIEKKILKLQIENLKEVILHAEPLIGRTDGTIFNSSK
jgi:divalent metal cation (Fe/Co/Zn/Cd) transporter